MYVEELVGPSTITTLPEQTLAAFLDHGRAAPTLVEGVDAAAQHLGRLCALGVDPGQIGADLERDAVMRFRRSQTAAVESVAARLSRAHLA
jgi:transaldolase